MVLKHTFLFFYVYEEVHIGLFFLFLLEQHEHIASLGCMSEFLL